MLHVAIFVGKTMNQACDNVTMYCNYAHSLPYYYAESCTWLIKGLFTEVIELGFH